MTDFNASINDKNMEHAETIALKAVHFILANDEMQHDFITATGILPSDLESMVKEPEFLGGVLDFLLANDEKLIEFCIGCKIDPEEPARVRRLFPGASYEY
jgi:hypothetical protein